MLITRVITAVVLLCGLFPALFWLPPLPWRVAVALVLVVAAWEWARLARLPATWVWPYACATGAAGAWLMTGNTLLEWFSIAQTGMAPTAVRGTYGLAFLFWLLAVPWWFAVALRPAGWGAALAGWCVLLPFAAAVADLRDLGPWLLISVMALVWVADIAAYFTGRACGRRKLAPSVSPGKTWEGAAGGIVAAALYAWANWHFGNPLLAEEPLWRVLALAGLLLPVTSIAGDLFESAMKRAAGLKDSSGLLPGHGGVLDRIDSLTSTLPMVALLLIWSGKL